MATRFDQNKVPPDSGPSGDSGNPRRWLPGLALVVGVVLTYLPVWFAGFVWDDDAYLTLNPHLNGLTGLKEIWTTGAGQFFPLVLTTFWLIHAACGLDPLPYHLLNVLLQAGCALVLWRVLCALRIPGAWMGAALWALHPVAVESVAWVSELKNTQSTFFYLLALLFFLKGPGPDDETARGKAGARYALSLIFAALALASKSSTVVLPIVLGLCTWWTKGRCDRRDLGRLAPFFLLSLAAGIVTITAVSHQNAADDHPLVRGWPERFITAGNVIWFYLGKLLWPHPLAAIYPRWKIDSASGVEYLPLLAAIAVAWVLWRNRGGWGRPWFFAYAYFIVALLPVLGLINHGLLHYTFVADHLQYLAAMGPLALAGAGLQRLADGMPTGRRWLSAVGCGAVLLVLGVVSWQRAWVYQSTQVFWADALLKNFDCWTGNFFLGADLLDKNQPVQAELQFRRAVEINPDDAATHRMLGNTLLALGRTKEAQVEFRRAVQLRPVFPEARINLGGALLLTGEVDEAIVQLREALKEKPDDFHALANLAGALASKGDLDGAIDTYREALTISPAVAAMHRGLGFALLKKGRMDAAAEEYRKTIDLAPQDADAHYHLGNIELNAKQTAAAIDQYQAVLAVRPNDAKAHNNLGIALAQTGHADEAVAEFTRAVQLDPGFADAQRNLALAKEASAKQKSSPRK